MVLNHRYKARLQFKIVLRYRWPNDRWSIALSDGCVIILQLSCSLGCSSGYFLVCICVLVVRSGSFLASRYLNPLLSSNVPKGSFNLRVKGQWFTRCRGFQISITNFCFFFVFVFVFFFLNYGLYPTMKGVATKL